MKQISILLLAAIVVFLSSCGNQPKPEEVISSELEAYRQQVRDLNKKIEEKTKELEALTSGQDNRMRVPVNLQQVEAVTFNHFFEASGSVIPVNEAFISPEVNGQVSEILVNEGDRVKKGQLLMRLNTDITDKTIQEVETSLALATDVFNRQKRLWDQKIGSEIQFLEAKNNKASLENRLATLRAQLEMSDITAPIDGIIEKVNLKKGELAVPGMQVIQLVNLSKLYVRADISENYLPYLKMGDEVTLTFPSYPGYMKKLNISRIGNVVNINNRTFEIELELENTQEELKPNMVGVIKINDFTAENSMVAPSKVIKEDLNGHYLYIAVQDGNDLIARKRYIQIGRTFNDQTRVVGGLEFGDKIIVDGFNRVSDGSLLKLS